MHARLKRLVALVLLTVWLSSLGGAGPWLGVTSPLPGVAQLHAAAEVAGTDAILPAHPGSGLLLTGQSRAGGTAPDTAPPPPAFLAETVAALVPPARGGRTLVPAPRATRHALRSRQGSRGPPAIEATARP